MSDTKLNITIAGLSGKMGQAIARLAKDDSRFHLNAITSREADALCEAADLVIDFSRPEFTKNLAETCAKTQTKLVSGTTGLSDAQIDSLKKASEKTAVLYAANMSLGVNLLSALVAQAAARLDDQFDIEILEMHHRHKVDAPSGTALMLGEAAAKGRNVALNEVAVKSREGIMDERKPGDIGFATLRGGSVVGEHEVIFASDQERIRLGHMAENRDVFAKGALEAAHWLSDKPSGFYQMKDVLGL